MKRTIALDFDGVLHSYTSGWQGADVVSDPPVYGMAEACDALIKMGFDPVIMSSRAQSPAGVAAMERWLCFHKFPPMRITHQKVPAEVYIDDRGYRFDGNVGSMMGFILGGMEPWNKGQQIRG